MTAVRSSFVILTFKTVVNTPVFLNFQAVRYASTATNVKFEYLTLTVTKNVKKIIIFFSLAAV